MADTAEIVLEVKDLDISFRSAGETVHAIRGVNLILRRGETVALVGESGSGKSVTMKAAMGILADNARINGIFSGSETLSGTAGEILVNRYEELGLQDEYYPFGTDSLGRDLFSRCFQGLRVSVLIALAAALIDLVIGVNYGMISGYLGGKVDLVMQQIVDIAGSIPSLVVVTLLMLVLKPGVGTIIFALMLTGWMEMSIIARTQVLRLKDQEFVQAARTLGAGNGFILFKEILPNIMGTLITQIMVSIPGAIFLETFLSFVGLGLPLGSCSLGRLISEGFENCLLHPYKLFPCMVILVLLMIACNLVADGLREAFDTRTVR